MIVNKGNKRYKHLTQDDRNTLEIMLQNAATFQTIAAALGKDACTISREVRKHRTLVANRFTNYDEQNNVINESCPKLEKAPYPIVYLTVGNVIVRGGVLVVLARRQAILHYFLAFRKRCFPSCSCHIDLPFWIVVLKFYMVIILLHPVPENGMA